MVAGWDPAAVEQVLDWPLENALGAFRERLRAEATEQYRADRILYALGGLAKPPEIPAVLKERAEE